jgi:hypothetical protein
MPLLLFRRSTQPALPHKSIPLFDPRSLSPRHAPLPALGLFISQRHISAMPIKPALSTVVFYRQIGTARFTGPAPLYGAGIGRQRLYHLDLDLRHGGVLLS